MSRPINDAKLGRLEYDNRVRWYSATLNTPHGDIKIYIDAQQEPDLTLAISHARQLATSLPIYEALAKEYAVEDLLVLKNESWLEDGEDPLDPQSFKSRMTLTSAVVSADGEICLYHDDGDLFWGHTIQVGIGSQRQKLYTDIPG